MANWCVLGRAPPRTPVRPQSHTGLNKHLARRYVIGKPSFEVTFFPPTEWAEAISDVTPVRFQ